MANATRLRHEDSTVSVVSCLPISRGTVAVSVRYPTYLPVYLDVITSWSSVDMDDNRGARISPGGGAESSPGWARVGCAGSSSHSGRSKWM